MILILEAINKARKSKANEGQPSLIRNKTQIAVTNMKLNKPIAKIEFHSLT